MNNFELRWIDEDHDECQIASDLELLEAINITLLNENNQTLKVYVHNTTAATAAEPVSVEPEEKVQVVQQEAAVSSSSDQPKVEPEPSQEAAQEEQFAAEGTSEDISADDSDDDEIFSKEVLVPLLIDFLQTAEVIGELPQAIQLLANGLSEVVDESTANLLLANVLAACPNIRDHAFTEIVYPRIQPHLVTKLQRGAAFAGFLPMILPQFLAQLPRILETLPATLLDLMESWNNQEEGCMNPQEIFAPMAPLFAGLAPLMAGFGGMGMGAPGGFGFPFMAQAQAQAQAAPSEEEEVPEVDVKFTSDIHVGINCDDCGMKPIQGVRYKCTVCPDFDLCATCEAKNEHDANHPFVKIRVVPRNDVHYNVACDDCGMNPIEGARFKCTTCPNFDLCSTCEAKDEHAPDHTFLKMKVNRRAMHQAHGAGFMPRMVRQHGRGRAGCRRGNGFGARAHAFGGQGPHQGFGRGRGAGRGLGRGRGNMMGRGAMCGNGMGRGGMFGGRPGAGFFPFGQQAQAHPRQQQQQQRRAERKAQQPNLKNMSQDEKIAFKTVKIQERLNNVQDRKAKFPNNPNIAQREALLQAKLTQLQQLQNVQKTKSEKMAARAVIKKAVQQARQEKKEKMALKKQAKQAKKLSKKNMKLAKKLSKKHSKKQAKQNNQVKKQEQVVVPAQCPQAHALTKFETHHNNFNCDICLEKVLKGTVLHGCRKCDYDVCEPCLSGGKVKEPLIVAQPHVFSQPTVVEPQSQAEEVQVEAEVEAQAQEVASSPVESAPTAVAVEAEAEKVEVVAEKPQPQEQEALEEKQDPLATDPDFVKYAPLLKSLEDVGFTERNLNMFLLKHFKGDITNVCNWYLARQQQ